MIIDNGMKEYDEMLDDFIQVMLAKVYGAAPVSVLKRVYKIYTGAAFKIAELREAQENQDEPTDDNDIVTWHIDGKYVMLDGDDPIKRNGDEEYFIPSKEEVKQLISAGYVSSSASDALKKMLTERLQADEGTAEEITARLWQSFSMSEKPQSVAKILTEGRTHSLQQMIEIGTALANFYNSVCRSDSCGYSPDMLYEIQHKEKSPDVEVYIKDDNKHLEALRNQVQQRPVKRTRLKRR